MLDLGAADLAGIRLGEPFSQFTDRFPAAVVEALPLPHAHWPEPCGAGTRAVVWSNESGTIREITLFLDTDETAPIDAALQARHGPGEEASAHVGGAEQSYLLWDDPARPGAEIARVRYADGPATRVKVLWQLG